jgi:lipid II isoglutaminyl synthase (glutamine-hydrolysing)
VTATRESTVAVVLLYPDLLGTYGDGGNATILAQRLRWRGQAAEVITVRSADPIPHGGDVYVVGGGEDLPQTLAARQLGRRGPLHRAVDDGAAVLAVCAGLQILGTSFVGPDGTQSEGLGLVDARTLRGHGPRAVGELVVEPSFSTGLPILSGYENHGGVTELGPDTRPLGRVRVGVGNGTAAAPARRRSAPGVSGLSSPGSDGVAPGSGVDADGFLAGRVVGTYLHGPALARNPALADHLLTSVLGPLEPLDDTESLSLRDERLAVTGAWGPASTSRGRWRRRLRAGAAR